MLDIFKIGMTLCAALVPISWTTADDPGIQLVPSGNTTSSADSTILDIYEMYLSASEEEKNAMDQIMTPSVKQNTVDWIHTQNAVGMSSELAQKVNALRKQDTSLPEPVYAKSSQEASQQTPAQEIFPEEQNKEKDPSEKSSETAPDTDKSERTDNGKSDEKPADSSKTNTSDTDAEKDPDKSGTDDTTKTDAGKQDPIDDGTDEDNQNKDKDTTDDTFDPDKTDEKKPSDSSDKPKETDEESNLENDTPAEGENPDPDKEHDDSDKSEQTLPEAIDAPQKYETVVTETLQPASDSKSAPVTLSAPAIIRKETSSRQIRVRDLGWYESEPDYLNQNAWKQSRSSYNTPGLWGQCTWFAWGRFYEMYGFDPGFSGNGNVCVGQLVSAHPDQFELAHTPKAGAVFSSDMNHNHVGIILDVNPETGDLLVQEGNLDGVSNTDWSVATADYRTIEISLDGLRSLYGDVIFANPIKGKVKAVHQDSRPSYLPTGLPDTKEEQKQKTEKLYGELYE